MKKSTVFTLLLLSSLWQTARACWYYPTGDDIRFCFFTDYRDYYGGYSMFNYTASYFSYDPPTDYRQSAEEDPNIALWLAYCNHKVSLKSIEEAVYGSALMEQYDNNPMVQYLYKMKDNEALEYLRFAKAVESYNEYYENPWERDEDIVSPKRKSRISIAIEKAKSAKNSAIKSRYYFLAIRMAFYNKDFDSVRKLYDEYFAVKESTTIIDYWSLYFRTAAEKDPALQSYYAALVFAKVSDKRFPVSNYFHNELPLDQILKHAKNKAADIYEMAGMRKTDYSLTLLEEIYKNNRSSEALGFLMVREMNKLEDWIYTPYYSYFSPSLVDNYDNPTASATPILLEKVADDRRYAAKLLQFVNSVNLNKVKDPDVFRVARAYLLFMVKDYNACLAQVNSLKKRSEGNERMAHQLTLIRALCLTANQAYGSAVIPQEVKPILMAEASVNVKFVFAIGRELEYLGNTTDAALIYSRLDGMDWKARDQRSPYYNDYYSYYFDYIDGVYSPLAIQKLITAVKSNKANDVFSKWLYEKVTDVNLLYDLLGTKYIRLNRLNDALAAFERMEPDSRTSGYLDDNPFYEIKYTSDFVHRKDSIQLTKADITKHLIKYISKGNNPREKDRDYYNFLAANCYLNMTQIGNTWYMRRYMWSSSELSSSLPDEADFHSCLYAKQYYLKAFKSAKTRKFRALCLRMASYCEHERVEYQYDSNAEDYSSGGYDYALSHNQYKEKLKKLYPAYYDDLYESGCVAYFRYFDARR
ncbi:hypothetical protein HYN59_16780 [Flavobacterium album]|uniref:Tetratricopeptide repeat protein n=1 Tax=Flavobacterium album TaxID=2175091 RepID=A0A2S1R1W6_9FLAO|nr:hypothetical protein [Flavobacterium album]AWH86660.1 hypothetical protein HYN59_16780 [Flavobacterium album]